MRNRTEEQHTATVFPACFVEMPYTTEGRRAAFYLAAEEYIADQLPAGNYLFTWQLNPTVVMGRNQVAHLELDLDFCKAEGIDIIRRKSGGGSIYADKGNIMVSLVTGKGAVEPLFADYASQVSDCLIRLGAPVTVSGRNDILLEGGGKICGNAFYHMSDRNIVHGTMLYDTDFRLMTGALTPDKSKLSSKGVSSVKSRIALLKDTIHMQAGELRTALRQGLTDRSVRLDEDDIKKIEAIESGYYDLDYLYGRSSRTDAVIEGNMADCGILSIHFALKGSRIEQVEIKGDFFALGDVGTAFSKAFSGKEYTIATLTEAIQSEHPERTIRGLSEDALTGLVADKLEKSFLKKAEQ